jgi:putative FmdB family regulatory protein
MPTYEYRCAKCGEDIEVFQTFSEKPLTRHAGCGGKLAKVLSSVGIVLKGSGFYKTDNRSGSGKSKREDAAASSDSSSTSESKTTTTSETKSSDSKGSSSDSGSGSSGNGAKPDGAKKNGDKKSPAKSS